MSAHNGTTDAFAALLVARRDVFGTFNAKGRSVERRPITEREILAHLDGTQSLGIYATWPPEGDTLAQEWLCRWGAIDLDVKIRDGADAKGRPLYRIDAARLAAVLLVGCAIVEEARRQGIILHLERTKEREGQPGGLHLWCFASEPIRAGAMIGTLRAILRAVAVPELALFGGPDSIEIFPKQARPDTPKGLGNYVDAPCYGALNGSRERLFIDAAGVPVPDQVAHLVAIQAEGMTPAAAILAACPAAPVTYSKAATAKKETTPIGSGRPPSDNVAERLARACAKNGKLKKHWDNVTPQDRSDRDFGFCATLHEIGWNRADVEAALLLLPGNKAAESGRADYLERTLRNAEAAAQSGAPAARNFMRTDLGNAERLVHRHGERLRYVHTWRKWIIWTGTHWATDQTDEVVGLASETVRSIYEEARQADDENLRKELAGHAARSESAQRVRGMLSLAEPGGKLGITHEGLDRDRFLLTVNNGTLDLRTGKLRPHRREDFITHRVNVTFDPAARCPAWLAFLETIYQGDAGLIRYVQKAIGYTLTGATGEQCFFLCHGQGQNGKTTQLEIMRRLLGTQAAHADFTTFLQGKRGDGPRTDIARLAGVRLVTAVEAEGGQKLSTVVIKQLTGGDTITARKLYAEEVEFQMQGKLWFSCNHRPRVTDSDLATWRRVKMIPFNATIPEAKRVKDYHEVLAAELPGILNWALAGCLDWQAEGLGTCKAVEEATADYQEEQDAFRRFLEDRCAILPAAKVQPSHLLAAYLKWAAENGEPDLSSQALWSKLQERQEFRVVQRKSNGARWWVGVGLRQASDPADRDARDDVDGVSVILQ